MEDFEQEEYQQEDHQGEDNWLGGSSDGDDQAAGAEGETHSAIDASANAPQIENFETIEEFNEAQDAYARLPKVPWHDDPLAAQRQELENHVNSYSNAADLATAKGDHARARHLKDMALSFAKDLRELPASPQQEFMEAAGRGQLEIMVDYLLDPAGAGDPQWNDPRLQHDSAVVVDKANRTSSGRITLPAEDSEHGTLAPATPRNLVTYYLDEQQLQNFKEMVYYSGESGSLDDVFRRSWDHLRRAGIDTAGHRMESPARPQANPEVVGGRRVKSVTQASDPIRPTGGSPVVRKDPGDMSQAEYEAWRRKSA